MTKKSIVIINNEVNQISNLSQILAKRGYETIAADIEQVFELNLDRGISGAVLIDLDTVDPGKPFFKRLAREYPLLRSILFTNRAMPLELRDFMSTNILACLRKPFDEDELVYLLKGLLEEGSSGGAEI